MNNETPEEKSARSQARMDWVRDKDFCNSYERGSLESLAYWAEAQKIRFQMEELGCEQN